MPIYEYHCRACESNVSVLYLSIASAPPEGEAECPSCSAVGLSRLASRFGFSAKTSGNALPRRGIGSSTPHRPAEDPRQLARVLASSDAGGDQDFKEATERLGKGESATSVETSLRKRVGETMEAH